MALVIRMRQQGSVNHQQFRIVLTDSKTPRDGKYLEKLGWYDPQAAEDKMFSLDIESIEKWVFMGAQMSENVAALVQRASPELIRKITERKVAKVAKKKEQRKKRRSAQKA